jgi:hypothetical protein
LKDPVGKDLFVLVTTWDTPQDAAQFFMAYLDLVDAKSLGEWELVLETDGARHWVGGGISVYLELGGDKTTLVLGPDRDSVDAIIGAG